jgi:hypothetical protein
MGPYSANDVDPGVVCYEETRKGEGWKREESKQETGPRCTSYSRQPIHFFAPEGARNTTDSGLHVSEFGYRAELRLSMTVHNTLLICSYLSWPNFHLSLSLVIMHVPGGSELFCSAQTATWLSVQLFIT